MTEKLAELRENLQQLQNQMNMQLKEEMMSAIRKAIYDLLFLSRKQEINYDTTFLIGVDESKIEGMVELELFLKENLDLISDRVYDIASKPFLISPRVGVALGEALKKVGNALEELSQRRSQRSLNFQHEAMTQINQAILALMSTMNQMNQSSSCSGAQQFFEQMQSLCQKQGCLNQQTMPLACPNPGGSKPGGSQPGGMTPPTRRQQLPVWLRPRKRSRKH